MYLVGDHKYKYYVSGLQQYPLINGIVKFGVAFPLTYHYVGGLRHLAWDNIIGNNVVSNRQTAYAAIGVASVLSVGAMFVEYEPEA
jgi:succinate dehydrogenase/fumarate reductase cytochrome b subunit